MRHIALKLTGHRPNPRRYLESFRRSSIVLAALVSTDEHTFKYNTIVKDNYLRWYYAQLFDTSTLDSWSP